MLQHAGTVAGQSIHRYVSPFQLFLCKRRYERHSASAAHKIRHADQQLLTRAINAANLMLDCAPAFDEPPRKPTDAETRAIAAGARYTPEQQLAKQLELPVTLRIKLAPGRPTDRQLMGQIQAAATWKELEAVVYQQRTAPPATPQKQLSPAATAPAQEALTATAGADESRDEGRPNSTDFEGQQMQQEGQRDDISQLQRRQPRRRQQPKPLTVAPRPASALESAGTTPATAAASSVVEGEAQALLSNTPLSPPPAAVIPTAGEYPKPSPLLNHLHVTEAIRRLRQLLPRTPKDLNINDRVRAAALIDFLTQQATALAYTLEIDARGIAHIALSLSKLGHKDEALLQEVQEAALLLVRDFDSRYTAMLLGALVGLKIQPDARLLAAIQQQISQTLHLYTHQSLANTIWALAKLSSMLSVQDTSSSSSSTPSAVQGIEIDQQLVTDLGRRCDPQMHIWSPAHLAQAVWGLGRLKFKPDEKWRQSVVKATYNQLTKMTPQDLSNVITGLPELGALPSQIWLDAFCTTAAAKMKHADAMGLYSLLFGLAKVKQQQHKVIWKAEKRRQRQQQQQQVTAKPTAGEQQQDQQEQQQLKPEQVQPGQQQLHHEPQAVLDVAAQSEGEQQHEEQQRSATKSAAANSAFQLEPVLSAPEVKFMCAAAMWLARQHEQLAQWQLAGVVISLSQLLPADIIQQAGAMQQQQNMVSDEQQCREGSDDCNRSHLEQQRVAGKTHRTWLSEEEHLKLKRQRLVAALASILPQLHAQHESVSTALQKKQARLFKVAWKRLWQLSSSSDSAAA